MGIGKLRLVRKPFMFSLIQLLQVDGELKAKANSVGFCQFADFVIYSVCSIRLFKNERQLYNDTTNCSSSKKILGLGFSPTSFLL